MIDQFRQRQLRRVAQAVDQPREAGEFDAAGAGHLRNRRMQAAVGGFGGVLQGFEAARTDAACRKIHHAGKGRVVVAVGDQAQIGQRVLDLGALEKAQPAIHAIGQAGIEQGVLQRARLGVAAVEQGDLGAGVAVALQGLDLLDDPARLLAVGERFKNPDRLTAAGLGPQVLAEARRVVLDDGIGGVEDVAVGAVVLLEADQVLHLELALEVAHVADVGAAEGVDALVVVTDTEQTGANGGPTPRPPPRGRG